MNRSCRDFLRQSEWRWVVQTDGPFKQVSDVLLTWLWEKAGVRSFDYLPSAYFYLLTLDEGEVIATVRSIEAQRQTFDLDWLEESLFEWLEFSEAAKALSCAEEGRGGGRGGVSVNAQAMAVGFGGTRLSVPLMQAYLWLSQLLLGADRARRIDPFNFYIMSIDHWGVNRVLRGFSHFGDAVPMSSRVIRDAHGWLESHRRAVVMVNRRTLDSPVYECDECESERENGEVG